MNDVFDWNSIVLGLLATCLFAECVILYVRAHSMKNKMEADAENIRKEEFVKYEKMRNELEFATRERELELKSEYEDLLSSVKSAKRETEDKLAEAKEAVRLAENMERRAREEFARFSKMKEEASAASDEYVKKLADLARLNIADIRKIARVEIERKCEEDLSAYRAEIIAREKRGLDAQARRMVLDAMQRISPEISREASSCVVKIPNDAIKGRLIGREGRNIRSFENETATTLVIDESPDSVMISSFNPYRRQIAKLALEFLIKDGRINPATIEEAVARAKEDVKKNSYENGAVVAERLGLARVHPDLLSALGELSLHLSMNQNTLVHSEETAVLCGLIASELDCDPSIAKRVGLFHDIGKALPQSDMSHAKAGAAFCERLGESEIVCNAVAAHHGEVPDRSVYASILQIADSLSAGRPGARMEAAEGYIQRIKTLEEIALSFGGVAGAYVIQAGRELRAVVSPQNVSDVEAAEIARGIRKKIEEMTNSAIPVKVTIIRESRFTETTKPRSEDPGDAELEKSSANGFPAEHR